MPPPPEGSVRRPELTGSSSRPAAREPRPVEARTGNFRLAAGAWRPCSIACAQLPWLQRRQFKVALGRVAGPWPTSAIFPWARPSTFPKCRNSSDETGRFSRMSLFLWREYQKVVVINWVQYLGPPGPFSFPDSRDLLEVLGGLPWQRESPREDPLGSGRIP